MEGAFDRLFETVEPEVRRVVAAGLRGRGDVDAAEVLQDVRIYVYKRLEVYDPAYPFVVFARGLARTITMRHSRGRGESDRSSSEDADEQGEPLWERRTDAPANLRASIGEERFPHPGEAVAVSPLFVTLLELFLCEGGYPHQQVAFGYSVLLWGRPKRTGKEAALYRKGEITGDPDRVVREIGPQALRVSVDEMLLEIHVRTNLRLEFLRRCTEGLERRLSATCARVFLGDAMSSRVFAALADRVMGTTRLEEYFGKDPRKSIADWTRAVKVRLKQAVCGARA